MTVDALSVVLPRSHAFVRSRIRRMTHYAEEHTECRHKGVACEVWSMTEGLYHIGSFTNGPPDGTACEETKPKGTSRCGCEHAEIRALRWLIENKAVSQSFVLGTSYSPCRPCAEAIVKSGVVRLVVYLELTHYDLDREVERWLRDQGVGILQA